VIGDWKLETGNWSLETGDWKLETEEGRQGEGRQGEISDFGFQIFDWDLVVLDLGFKNSV